MTNQSNPSPAPTQAQLSIDPSAQSPAPTHPGFRSQSFDMTISQGQPGSTGVPQSMPNTAQSQSYPSPVPPTSSAPTAPGPPSQSASTSTPTMGQNSPAVRPPTSVATGPGPGPRPGSNLIEQRRQFLGSLLSFHRQRNIEVPSAIFNGERDGAIKMGDIWIEVVELFMAVLRVGGLKAVSQRYILSLIATPTNFRCRSYNQTLPFGRAFCALERFRPNSQHPSTSPNTNAKALNSQSSSRRTRSNS